VELDSDIPTWSSELPYYEHDFAAELERANDMYPAFCVYKETAESEPCGERLVRVHKDIDEDDIEGGGELMHMAQDEDKEIDDAVAHDKKMPSNIRLLKSYSHQSMKAWLGRLLSRTGNESFMDEIWDRVRNPRTDGVMADIWDGSELRSFCGPDEMPFHHNPNNEGRYLFSLFVDWFNPLGNKAAGKVVSCGVIFMACLNMPCHLRYQSIL
jgi:hypothetical protein